MDLMHRFTVAASIDQVWAAFNRIELITPCYPGATLTSVDGDQFAGLIKIKFGPASMAYSGYGTYVAREEDRHRLVVEAKGLDRRGNGTGSATVTATLRDLGGDSTEVEVLTDVQLTGKPAQFGQGVISDISDRLLDQFVTNFGVQIAEQGAAWLDTARHPADAPAAAAREDITGSPDTPPQRMPDPARPSTPAAGDAGAAGAPAARAAAASGSGAAGSPAGSTTPRSASTFIPPSNTSQTDLDVLRTLWPVVAKRLGPGLIALALLLLIIRRVRNR